MHCVVVIESDFQSVTRELSPGYILVPAFRGSMSEQIYRILNLRTTNLQIEIKQMVKMIKYGKKKN